MVLKKQRQVAAKPREQLLSKAEVEQMSTVDLIHQVESLSQMIIQNPEEHINQLQVLLGLLEHQNAFIVQVVCLALAEVFVDISPMYKIDENAHEQKQQQMTKKDERNVIQFELKLLRGYKRYVDALCCFSRIRQHPDVQGSAFTSLCRLMRSLFHFNFANQIVQHVTFGLLNENEQVQPSIKNQVSQLVYDSVCEMLSHKQHSLYEIKMCILTYISKMLQTKRENELPDWLIECANTVEVDTKFLLKEIEKDEIRHKRNVKQQSQKREFFSQRDKLKKDKTLAKDKLEQSRKLLAEVKKEKEEAQVDYDKKQIAKQNADVLNKLFYLYCKIVKSTHLSKFFTSALDGILKFAHLINVELVQSLLEVLIDSCKRFKGAEMAEHRVQTILTLQKIMNGPGQAFEIDYTSTIKALVGQELLDKVKAKSKRW